MERHVAVMGYKSTIPRLTLFLKFLFIKKEICI